MNLSCVLVECNECNEEDWLSSGAFVRLVGIPLTDHSSAMIPKSIGCRKCKSEDVYVHWANRRNSIVANHANILCKYCEKNIPELFFIPFPEAHFCPLCVMNGQVSDQEVVAATGEFFAGEAYYSMSFQFRRIPEQYLKWLRKASEEEYLYAKYRLADYLSRSDNEEDVSEAATLYKYVGDNEKRQLSTAQGAEFRYAFMLLKGRGVEANVSEALKIMNRLAEKHYFGAAHSLGSLYLNAEHGVREDYSEAFKMFSKAYSLRADSFSTSAALSFMLLRGLGTKKNNVEGEKFLKESLEMYSRSKREFDCDACLNEILQLLDPSTEDGLELPNARVYLDWSIRFCDPLVKDLLDMCGGKIPDKKPLWEFSLSSSVSRESGKEYCIKDVRVPSSRDRISQPLILGQVEMLPDKKWWATTDDGIPIGDTFSCEKEAVLALAKETECDAEYIDLATRMKRYREKY